MKMEETQVERSLNLADYIVGSIPTLIYIPNFITQSEQSRLLHHIYQAPAIKWKSLKNRRLQNWVPPWLMKITERIRQQTGLFPLAINHVLINEYLPNQGIMPHQDGPAYFPVVAIISLDSPVVIDFTPHQRFEETPFTNSNSLHPTETETATTESIGLPSDLRSAKEYHHTSSSLLLMPRSLLIFKDQAYTEYLHGIQDSELHNIEKVANMSQCPEFKQQNSDRSQGKAAGSDGPEQSGTFRRNAARVSLTCRLVSKVHKSLFKI